MSVQAVGVNKVDQRIVTRFKQDVGFDLKPHLLVLATMGSHSHGTYLPPEEPTAFDDVDLMGFVVPPLDYHMGLPRWDNWRLQVDELDVVMYSLDKAMRLLLKSNPNIVGLLWLRSQDFVYQHRLFTELLAHRHIFSALTAADAFAGYAYGQLKRMEAFDLDRITEYEALIALVREKGPVAEVLEADTNKLKHIAQNWSISQEKLSRFKALHRNYFSGYMGEKRKALVRGHGYDVKNAAHLIRLLRMGKEYLATGELQVYRTTDADELKAIKRGEWTLDQVKAEAERLFAEVRAAEAASTLPKRPDEKAANRLLMRMHQAMLFGVVEDV